MTQPEVHIEGGEDKEPSKGASWWALPMAFDVEVVSPRSLDVIVPDFSFFVFILQSLALVVARPLIISTGDVVMVASKRSMPLLA